QKTVSTQVYEIPPPVTDIDLRLRCPPPPIKKKIPKITGEARVGERLTCSTGKWRNKPTGYDFLWQRGSAPIIGATKKLYRPTTDDVGRKLSCLVRARNSYGNNLARSKNVLTR
ncbi:MAG: hypothetical protein ACRDLB_08210, partial [Actinomycetota bacterium]